MHNFVFCNPTKIVFGEGTVSQIGAEARAVGRKALWVYGQSSIKTGGLYDRIRSSLAEAGVETVEHAGVRSNPVLSHTRSGIALAKKHQVNFILATGGGSVLDESKAIAAGSATDGDVWDFFTGAKTIQSALPVVTLLTIPATGSEMNGGLVITHDETRDKFGFGSPHLYPRVSVLDPTVTYSIPANYTAYSAVDAMAHLMEGYFTHQDPWAPIQDRYVEGLLKTIMEATEKILVNPSDYQARATMMWAASLAWNGLPLAGVGPVELPNHMLEHPLSGLYDIAHGAGLSIVIPAWMTYASRRDPSRCARLAENVFGIHETCPTTAATKGIAALKAWYEKVGSPTSFRAAGIPDNEIDRIVQRTVILAKAWHVDRYSPEALAEIYKLCV